MAAWRERRPLICRQCRIEDTGGRRAVREEEVSPNPPAEPRRCGACHGPSEGRAASPLGAARFQLQGRLASSRYRAGCGVGTSRGDGLVGKRGCGVGTSRGDGLVGKRTGETCWE